MFLKKLPISLAVLSMNLMRLRLKSALNTEGFFSNVIFFEKIVQEVDFKFARLHRGLFINNSTKQLLCDPHIFIQFDGMLKLEIHIHF